MKFFRVSDSPSPFPARCQTEFATGHDSFTHFSRQTALKTKRRSFLQTLAGFAGFAGLASLARGSEFCEPSLLEADSQPIQTDDPGNERPSGKMAEEQVEIVDHYDDDGRLLQRTVCVPGSFVRNTTFRVFPH